MSLLIVAHLEIAHGQQLNSIKVDTIRSKFDPWERYIVTFPEFYHPETKQSLNMMVEKYTATDFISLSINHTDFYCLDNGDQIIIEYEDNTVDTLHHQSLMSCDYEFSMIYNVKDGTHFSVYGWPYGKTAKPFSNLAKTWRKMRLVRASCYKANI